MSFLLCDITNKLEVDLSLALIVCIVKIYAPILKFAYAKQKKVLFFRICAKKGISRFFTVHLQTIVADYVV